MTNKTKQNSELKLDSIDIRILSTLQKNADISVAQLAGLVGLSATPCWSRIQRLTQNGYIAKKVSLLDPEKIGVEVVVFMAIKANHQPQWMSDFQKAIKEFAQITGAYRMSGEIDYLLKVQVADIKQFDQFYKQLVARIPIEQVTSNIALEVVKSTTELDLENLKKSNNLLE